MKDITVKPDINIRQAMKTLSQSGEKCLVIIDEKKVLLGTLSDGDVRKAILKGTSVGDSIRDFYYPKPTVLVKGEYSIKDAKKLFTQNKFDLIPVVDEKGKLVDILFWGTIFKEGNNRQNEKIDAPVVIMAGGRGTRLELFTKVLPKPLVPIHEKPVIEHIIERFTDVGVNKFIITINYKARIMKAYFEELNPVYSVDFVEEQEPLGTAGSLKFLENKFDKPFMVTNCDIIIKIDYLDLYEFHQKNNYDITVVASMKNYTIPYGTCELNGDGHLKIINEKPKYDFLVSTGLYVLNPSVLEFIPRDQLYHITHLIEDAKKAGRKVGVFPIHDDMWIDVGQWAEYKKAVERL
jgi:dTDP-glucose pyrophosphorylase